MPAIQTIKGDQIITSSVAIGHPANFVFDNNDLDVLDLSGSLIFRHSGSVPVSPLDAGIIFYDKVTQKLRASLNGEAAEDIVLGSSGGGAIGSNLGPQVGQNIYNGNLDATTLSFRRLLAGNNIGLLSGSDTIMISFTGTAGGSADGANVGAGQGIYNGNQDTDTLEFRSLLPGYGIGFSSGSQTLMINATGSLIQFSKTANIVYPSTNTLYPIWRVPYACTASYFAGYMLSGSRARICVYKNNASNPLFPTGTVIIASQSWQLNNAVHGLNGHFVIGDTLLFRVVELTGAVGQMSLQLNLSTI